MVDEWEQNTQSDCEKLSGPVRERFPDEMRRYRKYNEFSGEIGDLMASTLANVLKIPFALFTSIPNFPLMSIRPVSCLNDSNVIIYLAFDNTGCGHYDAIVDASIQSATNVQIKPHQYVRVENTHAKPEEEKSFCDPKSRYGSRCPYLRANASCSSKCKCKKCANPFGVSTKDYHEEQSKISRKRKRTEMGGERLRGEDFF